MGNPRATRVPVHVLPYTGADIAYGFLTNASAGDRTTLGHNPVTGVVAKLVFGCNKPKPGRASKGGTNSFYDISKATALRTAKWRLTSPKVSQPSSSGRSKSVYVTIDGVKYGWKVPSTTYAALAADRAALGIIDATSTMKDVAFGCRQPKPPRARREVTTGTGANQTVESYSTFYDPSGTIPAEYSKVKDGVSIAAGGGDAV